MRDFLGGQVKRAGAVSTVYNSKCLQLWYLQDDAFLHYIHFTKVFFFNT